MNHTGPIPEDHIAAGYFVDVRTQILIRCKNDLLVLWKTFNDHFGITACNDHITQGLNAGAAVDITHHHMVRMLLFKLFEKWRWAAVAKGTTRLQIRDNHFLSGI